MGPWMRLACASIAAVVTRSEPFSAQLGLLKLLSLVDLTSAAEF